jgi:hypothetical protein
MTPTFSPPPSRRPARRRWRALAPENRSIQIGIGGTLLVHLLLFLLAPQWLLHQVGGTATSLAPVAGAAPFEVQLAPEAVAPEPPKPVPPKFVETNPNAPENIPDQTNNFGAQNQQVAQPVPTPNGKSDTPASVGEKDKPSTAIVSGLLTKPPLLPVVAPPPTPPTTDQRLARRAQNPLPGVEPATGANPEGTGSTVAPAAPGATANTRVEGNPSAIQDNGFTFGLPRNIDPQHPQPQPKLAESAIHARPTPLLNNFAGTDHTGLVAYDAKWNSYSEYLQRLIECVQEQWDKILEPSSLYPERGSRVQVKFRLNSEGKIAEIVSVTGTGNRDAESACVSAIVEPAPYGPWSADMITTLGKEQELTFVFYYE